MKRLIVVAGLTAVALFGGPAAAYDSAGAEVGFRTYRPQYPEYSWPFGDNYQFYSPSAPSKDYFDLLSPDRYHYEVRAVHTAFGGLTEGTDGTTMNSVWCPPDALMAGGDGAPTVDVARCAPFRPTASNEPSKKAEAHLTSPRRAWNVHPEGPDAENGDSDEHRLITEAALAAAGLRNKALFQEAFYIRYPTADKYVVVPATMDPSTFAPTSLFLSQTFRPEPWATATSQVMRGFRLSDLSQLPDTASSLWDWVAGNELCPIPGVIDPATGVTPFGPSDVPNAHLIPCHSFAQVLGPVNASHFLPLAKHAYLHFHTRAIDRMGACRRLASLRPNFALAEQSGVAAAKWIAHRPLANDEARECEAEAFAYEMVAQHFLQDAWSTGHMWARWGTPELEWFPDHIDGPVHSGAAGATLVDAAPAAANLPARRYVIAGTVAALAGQIHGSKAVAVGKARELVGRSFADLLEHTSSWLDDPLCGPDYVEGVLDPLRGVFETSDRHVQWRDLTGPGVVFDGAGDLFWDPPLGYGLLVKPTVSSDFRFAEQRKRLLGCAAISMRQVYAAGPQSDGELVGSGAIVDGVTVNTAEYDPMTPEGASRCFDHLATNESMYYAASPLNLMRVMPQALDRTLQRVAINYVNSQVFDTYAKATVMFPDEADKQHFKRVLNGRIEEDSIKMEMRFAINKKLATNGYESAMNPGAMIGVLPNAPPTSGPPASFYDGASAVGDTVVRRAFWRSHLEQTCADAVALTPGGARPVLDELRDRCIRAAAIGGDTEACTSCVELAEIHVPQCGMGTGLTTALGLSKCEAVGADFPRTSVPAAFRDPSLRTSTTDKSACGVPAFWYAVTYCTGVPQPSDKPGEMLKRSQLLQETALGAVCKDLKDPVFGTPMERTLYRRRYRNVVVSLEQPNLYSGTAADGTSTFVARTSYASTPGALVSAFDSTVDDIDDGTCLPKPSEGVDTLLRATVLRGFPLEASGYPNLVGDKYATAAVLPCNEYQRLSFWNQSCEDVDGLVSLGSKPTGMTGLFDPPTGYQAWTSTVLASGVGAKRCSLREARMFAPSCSTASASVTEPTLARHCSASGLCVTASKFVDGLASNRRLEFELIGLRKP